MVRANRLSKLCEDVGSKSASAPLNRGWNPPLENRHLLRDRRASGSGARLCVVKTCSGAEQVYKNGILIALLASQPCRRRDLSRSSLPKNWLRDSHSEPARFQSAV